MLADGAPRCRVRYRGVGSPGRGPRCGLHDRVADQHRAGAGRINAATTIGDLLDQLQGAYNNTLDHQHLALSEIHKLTGHDQLFDTLFVYENYPIETAHCSGADGLTISDFSSREYNHYPLTVQAVPGHEIGLRVEFDTEVFTTARIEKLIQRLQRVLVAMTAEPDPATVGNGCAGRG